MRYKYLKLVFQLKVPHDTYQGNSNTPSALPKSDVKKILKAAIVQILMEWKKRLRNSITCIKIGLTFK